jgi:hypothetical protein
MLQAGRSCFRDPMRSLNFFNLPNPSGLTRALGFTQRLTDMITRNIRIVFLGSRARPVR